jgi:hypothetical protein
MQAWFHYPRNVEETRKIASQWSMEVAKNNDQKPFITAFHLNLLENTDAPFQPHKFGGSVGRKGLLSLLESYQGAGVGHMVLHLRRSLRPVDEAMQEIAEYILPSFTLK